MLRFELPVIGSPPRRAAKDAVVACGLPYSNTRAEGNTRKQLISLEVVLPGEQSVGACDN
jgi:hypothetical protein